MIEKIKEQGTLLTVSLVVLIITGGVLVIDRPDNWLNTIVFVLALLGLLAVFVNARVVIKSGITVLVAIFGAVFGFENGMSINPTGNLGAVWGVAFLALFFLLLTISYYVPSVYSRWTLIGISMIVSWAFIYISTAAFLNSWGVLVGTIVGTLFFLLFYLFLPMRSLKLMPENVLPKKHLTKLKKKLERNGYDYIEFKERKSGGYLLVWKANTPHTAYVLYPIIVDQPFGNIGKKKRLRLSYKGKSINYWLLRVVSKIVDNRYIGSGPLTVLWDFDGSVTKPRVIGVEAPDYTAPIAVGLISGNSPESLAELERYAGVIKSKQLEKLEKEKEGGK